MTDKSDSEIESERTLAILQQVLANQLVLLSALSPLRPFTTSIGAAINDTESMLSRIFESQADAYRKQKERASAQSDTHGRLL